MAAGVDIDDVDGFDFVEIGVHGKTPVRIDDARIEAHSENGGHAGLPAVFASLPFVVVVPGRGFAYLGGIFVDGGIEIGGAGFYAGAHDRHIEKGRSDVDHD